MSTLVQELDRYLTIRRSLGYDLGTTARVFGDLLPSRKAERRSMSRPTCSWHGKPSSAKPISRLGRHGWEWSASSPYG